MNHDEANNTITDAANVIEETLDIWSNIPKSKKKSVGKQMKDILKTMEILECLMSIEPTEEGIKEFKKKYPEVDI